MTWESAAQSGAIDTWLHKQIRSPSHGILRAKLLMLSDHCAAFKGDVASLDFDDVKLDPVLGLQPRYPDLSVEGDPILLTPAYVLAALCYQQGVALSNLSSWLESIEIVQQWLLLPPLAWRSMGLQVDAIPEEVLHHLCTKGQLQSDLYSAWRGILPQIGRDVSFRAGNDGPIANKEALDDLQALGLTRQQSAKKLFLELAPVRILSASEVATLANAGLDLSSLPIPLNDPPSVEVYWLWNKSFRSPDLEEELARTGLNALMVQAFLEPRFSLSHFEMITHRDKDIALLRVIELSPHRLSEASAKTKRTKLQDELGL
jgi:hypothetical protein